MNPCIGRAPVNAPIEPGDDHLARSDSVQVLLKASFDFRGQGACGNEVENEVVGFKGF